MIVTRLISFARELVALSVSDAITPTLANAHKESGKFAAENIALNQF